MLPGSARSPDGRDPLIGRVLGEAYRVEELIGTGGYGDVYRGTQLAVGRDVAIKVLRHDRFVAEEEKARRLKRFKREAVATSRLAHPNTVRLIDFGESEDHVFYLVLELLRGTELSDLIDEEAPLDPDQVAKIARQVCGSLSEAHAAGIIHRDLKPGNIFVCEFAGESDFVKVMDFSIARLVGPDKPATQLTISGTTQGTPHYMAPEQALAEETGPRTDLYALGCIIYEMLTGELLFPESDAMSVLLAHVQKPPPSLRLPGRADIVVASWQALLDELLDKDPKKRLGSATEAASKLAILARGHATAGRSELRHAAPTTKERAQADGPRRSPDAPLRSPDAPLRSPLVQRPREGSRHEVDTVTVDSEVPERGGVPSNAAVAVAAFAAALLALGAVIGATRLLTATDVADPAEQVDVIEEVVLELTTLPAGASVFRVGDEDGDPLCTTPCDDELPPGTEADELVLKLEGHQDARVTVDLTDDVELDEPIVLTATASDAAPEGDDGAPATAGDGGD